MAASGEWRRSSLGGLLIVFSLWWMYFSRDHASIVENPRAVWLFGYGHLPVFASIAAVGAALAAAVDVVEGEADAGTRPIALALAVAVSVVALALSGLHALSDRETVATMVPAVVVTVLLPRRGAARAVDGGGRAAHRPGARRLVALRVVVGGAARRRDCG